MTIPLSAAPPQRPCPTGARRRGGGAAAEHGARLVVVNAETAPYDALADEVVGEPIGTALPELLRGLRG